SENTSERDGPAAHRHAYQYSICLDTARRRHDAKSVHGRAGPEGTMRVIAGQYRHRTLRSLPGLEIRPTSDRLRETLFNVLCSGDPEALAETTWLDLYAGTG